MKVTKEQHRAYPGELYKSLKSLAQGGQASGLALDVSEETRRFNPGLAITNRGICIPLDMLRGLTTNVYSAGGALVGAETGTVADVLRPASACLNAGAQMVSGLSGNLTIPRGTSEVALDWLHESETLVPDDPEFGSLTLTPHRLSGAVSISSQLEAQTAGIVSNFLLASMARGIAAGLDRGALQGTGTLGEPLGILNSNVQTISFSATATLANAVSFERKISDVNGANPSFVASPDVKEKWSTIQKWTGASRALWEGDRCADLPAQTTSNMATGGIVCGDWSQMIFATWGAGSPIHVIVNPFSLSLEGRIQLVVTIMGDVGILRPTAFVRNSGSAAQ